MNKTIYYTCDVCGEQFSDEDRCAEHERAYKNGEYWAEANPALFEPGDIVIHPNTGNHYIVIYEHIDVSESIPVRWYEVGMYFNTDKPLTTFDRKSLFDQCKYSEWVRETSLNRLPLMSRNDFVEFVEDTLAKYPGFSVMLDEEGGYSITKSLEELPLSGDQENVE